MATFTCPECGIKKSETQFCPKHGAMECDEEKENANLQQEIKDCRIFLAHLANKYNMTDEEIRSEWTVAILSNKQKAENQKR